MSIKNLIVSALNENPIRLKEAFAELMSERIRCACEKKIAEGIEGIEEGVVARPNMFGTGYRRTDGLKVGDKVRAHDDYPVNAHGIVKDIHPHVVKVRWNGAQHDATVPHRNVRKLDEEIDLYEGLESGDYSLKKTGEKKSTTAHPNGKDIFHLYHKDEKIGSVEPYSGYKETRKPGARIVSSRKDVTHYAVRFDKDKGPRSGNGNDQISVRASHGHALPAHALETAVRKHSWWKKSIKEDLDENTEMKGDHLISAKLIHKDLKNIDSLSPDSQKILKRHEKQMITKYGNDWRKKAGINEGVGLKYKPWHRDEWKAQASHMGLTIKPATDLEGNSGNLIIAKDKFGNTKGQFHHKTGGFLDESEQIDEVISKAERRNLAYFEKQAVRAAEKANVGALPRSDKEKWIDDYIAKNFIPKGAVGSAVYSGVMKVRPIKAEK